jgi:hypothetical protein
MKMESRHDEAIVAQHVRDLSNEHSAASDKWIREGRETIHLPAEGFDPHFVPFPKIARLRREVIVTEKIDGTNAAVGITEDGRIYAQSRRRIITPDTDNQGFAQWVAERTDVLLAELGPGLHFGEWWGLGIQRSYGLDHRRFSLFNTSRWQDAELSCCGVVPVIGTCERFDTEFVDSCLRALRAHGSVAAPGFPRPEGVVVYHPQGNILFKQTLEDDDKGKSRGA